MRRVRARQGSSQRDQVMTGIESILERLPYGLFTVVSREGDTPAAMVATWIMQVSFTPPLLAVAVERDSRMRRCIEASGTFSVNLMPEDGIDLAREVIRSTNRGPDNAGKLFRTPASGGLYLRGALASIACRLVTQVETGDHILFVGEVTEGEEQKGGSPLLLHDTGWRYRRPKGEH